MTRLVHILRAGLLNYSQGLRLQQKVAKQNIDNFQNVLILTEHNPPVYTIGIRTKNYTVEDRQRLLALGAEFYETNRGGLITFHGPGQLVAYPIINLKQFEPSVRWYVCHIEKTIIDLCKTIGIEAHTSPDTGVWIEDRKICAIGIHGSRYITTHGLALNCNTDLKWFDHIVPCGIEGKGVTSLTKELKTPMTIADATPLLLASFQKIFQCDLVEMSMEDSNQYLEN